jgi:hypothetical protein
MAVTPKVPDFTDRSRPITATLTKFFTGTLWLLVATRVGTIAIQAAVSILLAIAVTRPLRAGHDFLFGLLFVVLFFTFRELTAFPVQKLVKSKRFAILTSGRPRFGPLQGPAKQTFQFILRCFSSVELRLEPEIEAVLGKVGDYDARTTERIYLSNYEKGGFPSSEWPATWARIQHTEYAGAEYGDAIRSNRWQLFWLRYYVVLKLVMPLSLIYAAGTFWFLDDAAQGRSPLRLVQFALLAGLVIALVIFINYTASLRSITIIGNNELPILKDAQLSMDAETRATFRLIAESEHVTELIAEIEPYTGKEYYPKITIKKGYIRSIRDEFARDFLLAGSLMAALLILLLLVQWPLARVYSDWAASQVDAWTVKMIIGAALLPAALVVALMLGFAVLARLNRLVGVLATTLILAVVPPLITYAVRGSVGNTVLLSSLVTAAIGAISSAVAELIRHEPSIAE